MALRSRLRPKGLAYLAAGLALAVAGAALDRPVVAVLGALPLVLVALQSSGVRLGSLRAARHQDVPFRAAEGDPVEVRLALEASFASTRVVEVQDRLPGPVAIVQGSNFSVLGLSRRRPGSISYSAQAPVFGIHELGPAQLRIEDPFGFYVAETTTGEAGTARIEPRASSLDATQIRSVVPKVLMGQYEVSQPGSGFDFFGLRDYNRSDRMRDVNWRATARTGKLVVNQHVKESRADVLLLLDARGVERVGHPVHCAWAVSGRIALEVTDELVTRRDAVRIVSYGARIREVRRTTHGRQTKDLVDLLLETEPAGGQGLEDVVDRILPTLGSRSPVILFSSLLLDPSIHDAAVRLLAGGSSLLVFTAQPTLGESVDGPESAALVGRDRVIESLRGLGATVVTVETPGGGDG